MPLVTCTKLFFLFFSVCISVVVVHKYLNRLTLDFFLFVCLGITEFILRSDQKFDLGFVSRYVISTLNWKFQPKYCVLRNRFVLQVEVLLFLLLLFFGLLLFVDIWLNIFQERQNSCSLLIFFVQNMMVHFILLLNCSHFSKWLHSGLSHPPKIALFTCNFH